MPGRKQSLVVRPTALRLAGSTLVLATLACGLFTRTTPPAIAEDQVIQNSAQTEEALFKAPLETSTPVHASLDDVQVDYVYTSGVVTALYHLYGSILDNFVDITITNNSADALTFLIQSEVEGYTTQAADTINVAAGEILEIHQNPRLLAESVDRLNSERPGNFHIRVVSIQDGNEKLLLDETRQILLYSRRDFVWLAGFEWQEEFELWAAWVTPTDPQVEALIRAAADYTETGTMWSGYGGTANDEDGKVWDRLQAIWRAEQEQYHVTYISTMIAFGPNTVQRIRLPNEVLEQASGNCIELAMLFNATAEALGLESAIIRIPGHAYTAIRMDEENANYYFIETTMIGQNSFEEAVNFGAQEWEDAKPHFDAKDEGYAWINIPDMRAKGILPIPWK